MIKYGNGNIEEKVDGKIVIRKLNKKDLKKLASDEKLDENPEEEVILEEDRLQED